MTCPSCGAQALATAEFCPNCLGSLKALAQAPSGSVLPAVEPAATPAVASPAVLPVNEAADPPPVPASAAHCAVHPELAATGTCARCGRFFCANCVQGSGKTCPECVIKEAPEKVRKLRRELWVSFVFAGAVASLLFVVMPIFLTRDPIRFVTFLLVGAITAIPLFVCGAVFGAKGKPWIAWVAVIFEAFVAIAALVTSGGLNLITAVLVAFPVLTSFRIATYAGLRRTMATP